MKSCLKYCLLLLTSSHLNLENLLLLLWGPTCESLGDWIFLINLVFWRVQICQQHPDAYWFWSTCSFPFFWSIINCFQNPWASCSCPTWVRKVRTWGTLPPVHHLSGKMWKRSSDYFIQKECYKLHSYPGRFTTSFQSMNIYKFIFFNLLLFWAGKKALQWICTKLLYPVPGAGSP